MQIFATILSISIALVYLVVAGAKLSGRPKMRETAESLGIPFERFRLIGIPELAGAGGLIIGIWVPALGVAAASGLAVLMSGAIIARLKVGRPVSEIIADFVLLVVDAAAAVVIVLAMGS